MMSSEDIIALLLSSPVDLLVDMLRSLRDGATIWVVDADSGDGRIGLFRSPVRTAPDDVLASRDLHALAKIPYGQLWISNAEGINVSPPLGLGLGPEHN